MRGVYHACDDDAINVHYLQFHFVFVFNKHLVTINKVKNKKGLVLISFAAAETLPIVQLKGRDCYTIDISVIIFNPLTRDRLHS